jgi:uncharacterized protein (DUF488 family)
MGFCCLFLLKMIRCFQTYKWINEINETMTTLFTIGFAKKSAEQFFSLLIRAGVKRIIDIRLHNVSQLAGFTKRDDLSYFLEAIAGIDYLHMPSLAPTQEIFDAYKKKKGGWAAYEESFNALLRERKPENLLSEEQIQNACLLCSEPTPDHCHRRLVAQYLKDCWSDLRIVHL